MRAPFNITIDIFSGPAFGNVLKARGVPARFITRQKHVTDSFSPLIPYYMTMPDGVPIQGSETADDGVFDFRIGDRLYDSFTGTPLMVVSWVETWLPGSTSEYTKARGKPDDALLRGGGTGGGELVITSPPILRGGGAGGGELVDHQELEGGGTGGGELTEHVELEGGGTGGGELVEHLEELGGGKGGGNLLLRDLFRGGGTGGGLTIVPELYMGGGTGGGDTAPPSMTSGGGTGGGSLS